MCGVVGAVFRNITADQIDFVRRLILESRIRGRHATGVSFIKSGKIQTFKYDIPADQFLQKHSIQEFVDGSDLTLIAHCRYSTSDLEYNQPIQGNQISIVHNGVISQEAPAAWARLYGFKTETKNDTELLLRSIEAGADPLSAWTEASISAVEIRSDKSIRFYRNGKRPLHSKAFENGVVVTSTRDIVSRADPTLSSESVPPGVYFTVSDTLEVSEEIDGVAIKDLQPTTIGRPTESAEIVRCSRAEVLDLIRNAPEGPNTRFLKNADSLWVRFGNYDKSPPFGLMIEGKIRSLIFATFNRNRYVNVYEVVTLEGQERNGYARRLWEAFVKQASRTFGSERLKLSAVPASLPWHIKNGLVFWSVDREGSLRSDQPLFASREDQVAFQSKAVIDPSIALPTEKIRRSFQSEDWKGLSSRKRKNVEGAIRVCCEFWLRKAL